MYESFFGMEHTPFVRDVPPEKLFESNAFRETLVLCQEKVQIKYNQFSLFM